MQAALAAAQQGAGYSRIQPAAITPQVPRPPVRAALGLDLSSLRLQTSSPTPLPPPQKVLIDTAQTPHPSTVSMPSALNVAASQLTTAMCMPERHCAGHTCSGASVAVTNAGHIQPHTGLPLHDDACSCLCMILPVHLCPSKETDLHSMRDFGLCSLACRACRHWRCPKQRSPR